MSSLEFLIETEQIDRFYNSVLIRSLSDQITKQMDQLRLVLLY